LGEIFRSQFCSTFASPLAVLYIINFRLILPSGCTHLMELPVQIPPVKMLYLQYFPGTFI